MAKLPDRVRIGVIGLGWVGQEVARAALEDPRVRLVGVADIDSAKAGRDLGEILGEGRLGLPIDVELEQMLQRARPEVAVVTTSSDPKVIRETIEQCLAYGAHVVTTCENLAAPELVDGDVVRALEEKSRQAGLVILSTGVNPGFAMDRLPVMLSQATRNIRRVRVLRVVDAASRRAQLQAKIGVGMDPKRFVEAMNEGRVGHAGLTASLRLVAKGIGFALDRVTETLRPLVAETPTNSSVLGPVASGRVRGIYQVARGYRSNTELITLELIMALDEPNARDSIDIVGEPPLRFGGELPGDHCTVATVLSSIPLVVTMQPGLRTVLDVPLEQPEEPGSSAESSKPASAATTRPDFATEIPGKGRKKRGRSDEQITQIDLQLPPIEAVSARTGAGASARGKAGGKAGAKGAGASARGKAGASGKASASGKAGANAGAKKNAAVKGGAAKAGTAEKTRGVETAAKNAGAKAEPAAKNAASKSAASKAAAKNAAKKASETAAKKAAETAAKKASEPAAKKASKAAQKEGAAGAKNGAVKTAPRKAGGKKDAAKNTGA